jgi:hypothetical protein
MKSIRKSKRRMRRMRRTRRMRQFKKKGGASENINIKVTVSGGRSHQFNVHPTMPVNQFVGLIETRFQGLYPYELFSCDANGHPNENEFFPGDGDAQILSVLGESGADGIYSVLLLRMIGS